jgi:hypothetical protein
MHRLATAMASRFQDRERRSSWECCVIAFGRPKLRTAWRASRVRILGHHGVQLCCQRARLNRPTGRPGLATLEGTPRTRHRWSWSSELCAMVQAR